MATKQTTAQQGHKLAQSPRLAVINNVSAQELLEAYNQGRALIYDLRTPAEYSEYHIPGSILLPYEELAERIDEIPRNTIVYIICRTGNRTTKAAAILAEYGYINIYNVVGGIHCWEGPLEGTADFL